MEWDKELFLYLNSFYNDYWDTVMLMLTRKETWFPFFGIILYYVLKNYRNKSWLIILSLVLLVVAADQVSGLMNV